MAPRPCAPRRPKRSQVITSSKTSSAPHRLARACSPSRKRGLGHDQPHVGGDRFDDDRRQIVLVRTQSFVDGGEIVVARDHNVAAYSFRNSAVGRTCRRCRRARFEQRQIEMPVVVAGKLEDATAAGEGASDAKRAHHRLGSRRDEAQALHGRKIGADSFGEPDLFAVRTSPDEPAGGEPVETGDQIGMRVAEEKRTVRHDIVHETTAGSVVGVRPPRARLQEHRGVNAPSRTDG